MFCIEVTYIHVLYRCHVWTCCLRRCYNNKLWVCGLGNPILWLTIPPPVTTPTQPLQDEESEEVEVKCNHIIHISLLYSLFTLFYSVINTNILFSAANPFLNSLGGRIFKIFHGAYSAPKTPHAQLLNSLARYKLHSYNNVKNIPLSDPV